MKLQEARVDGISVQVQVLACPLFWAHDVFSMIHDVVLDIERNETIPICKKKTIQTISIFFTNTRYIISY